jgi:transcriptional regulator with XRE-family HTH domain
MTFDEILNAIVDMDAPATDTPRPPPRELVAFFVRWERHLRDWKQSTLADFAGISLSTVERVERAEKVSDACLDRIAAALGHEPGYLTSPRLPMGQHRTIARLVEIFGEIETVPVRRVSTESQIRQFAQCHGCLLHCPEVEKDYDPLISELREGLDLASFVIGCSDLFEQSRETRRREFYGHILGCVRRLEESGLNVLGGVMHAPQAGIPDWKVAVVSITRKSIDPGAGKRRHVLVDRRCVEAPANRPRASDHDLRTESCDG